MAPVNNGRFRVTVQQIITYVVPIVAETPALAELEAEDMIVNAESPWNTYSDSIETNVTSTVRVLEDPGAIAPGTATDAKKKSKANAD